MIKLQFGKITKQADGRYKGHTRATCTQVEIDILPKLHKAADAVTDSRVMTDDTGHRDWMRLDLQG